MLKNLVGIVTGGASGLGKAAAKTLIKEGCKVTICDLPNSPGAEVARSLGPEASFAPMDILSTEEVEETLSSMKRRFKRIDFVVNCAGVSCAHKIYSPFLKKPMNLIKIQSVVNTNVVGTLNVVRLVAEHISENKPNDDGITGVIINVAGAEAYDGQTGQSIISATSGAIVSMTHPLAKDLRDVGIRVACVCVGIFDTPIIDGLPDNVKAHIGRSCILPKRFGTPEEFGHAIKFVLENPYVNGSVLRIDAGLRHFFD